MVKCGCRVSSSASHGGSGRSSAPMLRYILDPKEVHGEDFPGETFRVLKEKEIKQFGEYRTRRLVLEAWDAQQG